MPTLAEMYLADRGGSPRLYRQFIQNGQRVGQAFSNALSGSDADRLRGMLVDPFYKNTMQAVEEAIEWLLDHEDNTPTTQEDAHAPRSHHGRIVCSCGDFNCASLDQPKCPWCGFSKGTIPGICTACGRFPNIPPL